MRYLIDLTSIHNEKIQELIRRGKFQSVAAFIYTAIENQIYLESSSKEVLEHYSAQDKNTLSQLVIGSSIDLSVLLSRDINDIEIIKPPEDNKIIFPPQKEGSDANTWVWGQVNRIFPLKVALRVLGNMIKQGKKSTMDVNTFREKAAEVARGVGLKLLAIEKEEGRKRGEKVSSGLPIGEPEFKSKSRYKNHFLVSVRKDGMLDGALARFKFINIEKEENKKNIGITKEGLSFASLENPIIDKEECNVSFSDEEKEFYLKYVATEIPGEYRAIRWMLSAIKKGVNRREDINDALSKRYQEWTEAIVNTQRAGLMARMFELDLLDREKSGVEVTYKISKRGGDILKMMEGEKDESLSHM